MNSNPTCAMAASVGNLRDVNKGSDCSFVKHLVFRSEKSQVSWILKS